MVFHLRSNCVDELLGDGPREEGGVGCEVAAEGQEQSVALEGFPSSERHLQ